MYIFTSKNVLLAGVLYETIGVLLIMFSFLVGYYLRRGDMQLSPVGRVLSCLKKIINNNNFIQISMVIIVSTFLLAKFGRRIEVATIERGVISVDNAITVLVCIALALIFFFRYKIGLLFQDEKEKIKEEVSDDKLILSIGFVVLSSGVIAQVFGV
jgi:hypothetical protein